MDTILIIRNLKKKFGKKQVLNGVNFEIKKGEIVGYLGPNGSGKTTTLRIIMNGIEKDEGEIIFRNNTIRKDDVYYKKYIGYMPENATPFDFLNAYEYLEFLCKIYDIDKNKINEKIEEMLKVFGLNKDRKKIIRNYSKGMKQKLLFIGSIIHNPELLILDEPFSGIEPQTAMLMKNLIIEMKKQGTAIIFSSHILEIVEKLADRVILLHKGKNVGEGMVSDLRQKGGLEEFFTFLTDNNEIDEETIKIINTIKK